MFPISQNNLNITRGPKDSREFIKMCSDFQYDISQLFDAANQQASKMQYDMDILLIENFFLQARLEEMEKRATNLTSNLIANQTSGKPYTKTNTYRTQNDVKAYSTYAGSVDSTHGIITLPHNTVDKVVVTNTDGTKYMPPTTKIKLFESVDGLNYTQLKDSSVDRIFDGDSSSIWMHTSKYDVSEPVEKLYIVLQVSLPLEYVNNAMVNAISIKPCPEHSMTINNVCYTTPSNPNKKTIGNFSIVNTADKTLFTFNDTEISDLYIFMEQPYHFLYNDTKYFYYGLQELGIYFYDYNGDYTYIVSEFKLDNGSSYRYIGTPRAIFSPYSNSRESLVSHELFLGDGVTNLQIVAGGSIFQFNTDIVGDYSTAYILTKISKSGTDVPALNGLALDYTIF